MLSNVLSNSSNTWVFKAYKALGRFIVKIEICPSTSYLINSDWYDNVYKRRIKIFSFYKILLFNNKINYL